MFDRTQLGCRSLPLMSWTHIEVEIEFEVRNLHEHLFLE